MSGDNSLFALLDSPYDLETYTRGCGLHPRLAFSKSPKSSNPQVGDHAQTTVLDLKAKRVRFTPLDNVNLIMKTLAARHCEVLLRKIQDFDLPLDNKVALGTSEAPMSGPRPQEGLSIGRLGRLGGTKINPTKVRLLGC